MAHDKRHEHIKRIGDRDGVGNTDEGHAIFMIQFHIKFVAIVGHSTVDAHEGIGARF